MEAVVRAKLQCLTAIITYSMEQSNSWKANLFATSQEIPRILQNPKVHYYIHLLSHTQY
jgi:hypothetical protein